MVWQVGIGPLSCGAISRHRTYWYQMLVARRLHLCGALSRGTVAPRCGFLDRRSDSFCSQFERIHASPAYYFELRALRIARDEILTFGKSAEHISQIKRFWPFRWPTDVPVAETEQAGDFSNSGLGALFDDFA